MTTVDRLTEALSDRYRIERELGQGGMATVYLAEDLRHDRQVALKVLRPELAAVIGAERFLHEITTTANLQHPHILPLHDSGQVDGTVFYVMPFVEGESLRDRLNREKQLPVDDAVRIAREVAERARLCPPARRDPPRHQAREHPAARRRRAGRRLRHRAGGEPDRRHPDDRDRHVPRHAALHEPRAGDGRARRSTARSDVYALGCVLLRDARGRAAVHRAHAAGHRGAGDDRSAPVVTPSAADRSAERRSGGSARTGEAAGRPVRNGGGIRGAR